MAGLICDVNIPQASYTSGTTYNIICGAAPANQRVRIRSLKFAGAANSAQTPGLLQFCSATSGGVTGNPAVTPKPREGENTETPQSTWLALPTTAPTAITPYNSMEVNPQIGIYESYPDPEGYFIKGGGFWCLQFTSGWTGNYAGTLTIEE
jgi:hypothetical protein